MGITPDRTRRTSVRSPELFLGASPNKFGDRDPSGLGIRLGAGALPRPRPNRKIPTKSFGPLQAHLARAGRATIQPKLFSTILFLLVFSGSFHSALAKKKPKKPAKPVAEQKAVLVGKTTIKPFTIDWERGLLIATGQWAGDWNAPTVEMSRIKAERMAREMARKHLWQLIEKLRWADGTTGKDRLQNADTQKTWQAVAEKTFDLNLDYSSDGSTQVSLALPIALLQTDLGNTDFAEPRDIAVVTVPKSVLPEPVAGLALEVDGKILNGPSWFLTEQQAADLPLTPGQQKLTLVAQKRNKSSILSSTAGSPVADRPLLLVWVLSSKP